MTLLALQDEPQHQKAWARGAVGEEQVAKLLAKYLDDDVVVLHDRRIPGSRANIDHIAVAPSGLWVIDAKRCKGKATIDRPLLGKPRLLINRRDQAKLIDGLDRQVVLVRTAVAHLRGDIAGTPSAWRTQAMRVPASTTTGLHEKPSSQRVAVNAFTRGAVTPRRLWSARNGAATAVASVACNSRYGLRSSAADARVARGAR